MGDDATAKPATRAKSWIDFLKRSFGAGWTWLLALWRHVGRRHSEELREKAFRDAHPEFPLHRLTIDGPGYADLEVPLRRDRPVRVLFLWVTYTNRDATRRVNLEVDLLWSVVSGEQVVRPHRFSPYSGKSHVRVLTSPVAVDPETTIKGSLLFKLDMDFMFEFGEHYEVSMKARHYRLDLRVTDCVTGEKIERPVLGEHVSSDLATDSGDG
jgi:hypothetical protein